MAKFQDALRKYINQKVLIKDATGEKTNYTVKDVGDDYLIVDQNKKTQVLFCLNNIVSITRSEKQIQTAKKMSKEKINKEWDSVKRGFQKKTKKVKTV